MNVVRVFVGSKFNVNSDIGAGPMGEYILLSKPGVQSNMPVPFEYAGPIAVAVEESLKIRNALIDMKKELEVHRFKDIKDSVVCHRLELIKELLELK